MAEHLEGCKFIVNKTPYCAWGFGLSQKNLSCIDGLSADYFDYIAWVHAEALKGDTKHYAAVALRGAYHQGLETFLALLFAAIQAPQCVVGWLPKYRQDDLESLVESIHGKQSIYTLVPLEHFTWGGIAQVVHSPFNISAGDPIVQRMGKMWNRFAHDFLDDLATQEYNTIKHGMRAKAGGFRLEMGDSLDDMQSLGGSEFGSRFFRPIPFDEKHHFQVGQVMRNWQPENLMRGLQLIARSIRCIQAFLGHVLANRPATICWPKHPTFEMGPWELPVGVLSIVRDNEVRPEDIDRFSKEDIVRSYERAAPEEPTT